MDNTTRSEKTSSSIRMGLFEATVQKLFTRSARVEKIEELSNMFSVITLYGDGLKKATWAPGDKIQIQLGGWVQRTYTPLDWDSHRGRTRILLYLHGDSVMTRWARTLNVGDECILLGPRKSIDMSMLNSPIILFGDESSFGLASALKSTAAADQKIAMLFETSSPVESSMAIDWLGLGRPYICARGAQDGHLTDVGERIMELKGHETSAQFVLTGKSTSIQQIQKRLRQHGITSSQFKNKAYWAPGKKGLD